MQVYPWLINISVPTLTVLCIGQDICNVMSGGKSQKPKVHFFLLFTQFTQSFTQSLYVTLFGTPNTLFSSLRNYLLFVELQVLLQRSQNLTSYTHREPYNSSQHPLYFFLMMHFNTFRTGSFKLFKRPFPGFLTILTL